MDAHRPAIGQMAYGGLMPGERTTGLLRWFRSGASGLPEPGAAGGGVWLSETRSGAGGRVWSASESPLPGGTANLAGAGAQASRWAAVAGCAATPAGRSGRPPAGGASGAVRRRARARIRGPRRGGT